MLEESGCSQHVIQHCLKVMEVAKRLTRQLEGQGIKVNAELVETAAILHDIGRSKTHDLAHGLLGGNILSERGLPEDLRRVVERHVGAGIGKEEAVRLGLERKDLIPETIEEKIVCYADKLVDGAEEVPFEDTLSYFEKKFGKGHPIVVRLKGLHRYFVELSAICGKPSTP